MKGSPPPAALKFPKDTMPKSASDGVWAREECSKSRGRTTNADCKWLRRRVMNEKLRPREEPDRDCWPLSLVRWIVFRGHVPLLLKPALNLKVVIGYLDYTGSISPTTASKYVCTKHDIHISLETVCQRTVRTIIGV